MYRTFKKDIRLAETYNNPEIFEKLKIYMKANLLYIEGLNDKLGKAKDVLDLLAIAGIMIKNVSRNGYYWCTVDAAFTRIRDIEEMLQKNPNIFHEFSTLTVRNNKDMDFYSFDFSVPEKGFVCKPLPVAVIDIPPEHDTVFFREKLGYYTVKKAEIAREDAKGLYGMCGNPWCESAVSYGIEYSGGIYECQKNVVVYDGVEISVIGYGATPEQALRDCEENFERIKEDAYDEGYQED